MKIQKLVSIKVEIQEKVYSLLCEESAPLGAIWDALNEMRQLVMQQIQVQQSKDEEISNKEEHPEGEK